VQAHVLTDDELRRIRVSALVLTGRRSDLISPREARARAEFIPNAQAEAVTGARHDPSLDQTGLVNAHMNAFIATASGPRPDADLTSPVLPAVCRPGGEGREAVPR
jgi:pimeloyl-ACP methyl ester carboxylesterase